MRYFILLISILVVIAQDKKGISDFEKARLQSANRLNQLTKNQSEITFINLNNLKDTVNGTLTIAGQSIGIINGKAIIKKELLKAEVSNRIEAMFTAEDYISKKITMYHIFGLIDRPVYYVLDKRYPEKIQIVLNWNNTSRKYDLDSHIRGQNLHVYYRNKKSYGPQGSVIWLNRDVIRSNSYEMITLDKPANGDQYEYSIRKYRGPSDWHKQNVTVDVYINGRFDQQIRIDQSLAFGRTDWLVFNLDSRGQLQLVNRYQ